MQAWWMDAVSVGKMWDAWETMPYLLRCRLGMRYIVMPQQTQIGGYFLADATQNADDVAARIDAHLRQLHLAYYYQHFPLGSDIPKAMAKRGYRVQERVSYRIEDLHDMDAIRRNYSENKRRQLKKSRSLSVNFSMSPDAFYQFHADSLSAQGKHITYSLEFFDTLYRACMAHSAGQIIAISDTDQQVHAAAFIVYDKHTTYFLIPAYNPAYGKSGAGARLVDECIQFAQSHSEVFDFEGSMIPGVANHYRQFGSVPRTYCSVEKVYNPLFRILLFANQLRQ